MSVPVPVRLAGMVVMTAPSRVRLPESEREVNAGREPPERVSVPVPLTVSAVRLEKLPGSVSEASSAVTLKVKAVTHAQRGEAMGVPSGVCHESSSQAFVPSTVAVKAV